jgi:hypothetical protein
MNTIPETEIEQVRELAQEAAASGSMSAEMAIKRAKICVAIGWKLNAWKRVVPHGEFGAIRDAIRVSHVSAGRWMKLAREDEAGRLNWDDNSTLRRLYVQLGMVPPKTPKEHDGAASKRVTTSWMGLADELGKWAAGIDAAALTPEMRHQVAVRLGPIGRLWEACR